MKKSLLTVLALSSAMLLASCQPTPAASSDPKGGDSGTSATSADTTPMTLEAFLTKLEGHNLTAKVEGVFEAYYVSNELVAMDYGEEGFSAYAAIEGQGIAYFGTNKAGDIVFEGYATPNDKARIQEDLLYSPQDLVKMEDDWAKSKDNYVLQNADSYEDEILALIGTELDTNESIASVKLKLEAEVANLEVAINDGYGGTTKVIVAMSNFGTTTYELPAAALEEARNYDKTNWSEDDIAVLEYYLGQGNSSKLPFAGNFSKYASWDSSYFVYTGMMMYLDAAPIQTVEGMVAVLKGLGWEESDYAVANEMNDVTTDPDYKTWALELPLSADGNEVAIVMMSEMKGQKYSDPIFSPNGMFGIALMAYQYPVEGIDAVNAKLTATVLDPTAGAQINCVALPANDNLTNVTLEDYTADSEMELAYYGALLEAMMQQYGSSLGFDDDTTFVEFDYVVNFEFASADAAAEYLDAYVLLLVAAGLEYNIEDGDPIPTVANDGVVYLCSSDYLTYVTIGTGTDSTTNETFYAMELCRYTEAGLTVEYYLSQM